MKPNICVIVLDAVRPKNLSCYGHHRETSPRIDGIVDESLTYERAVAPTGVTLDSVTSLLSGLYPSEHQSGQSGSVTTSVQFLPELLTGHGYRTGAVTCNPFITPWFGFGRGFAEFEPVTHRFEKGMNLRQFFSETSHLPRHRRYLRFLREAADRNILSHLGNALQFKYGFFEGEDDGANLATDRSVEFVRESDSPWFLYVHYTETHMNSTDELPYSIPDDERFRFTDGEPDSSKLATRTGGVDYDEETVEIHERLYDAAIRYLDGHVGRLLDAIDEHDSWDDTLVVITADHGECIGEHGLLGHGYLYEPGIRVPLVLKTPEGVPSGERISERVNTIGLYRTLANVVGTVPDHVKGNDLFESPPSTVLTQDYSNTWTWSRYGGEDVGVNAIYDQEMKLIVRENEVELYDLEADPGEVHDMVADEPETVARLHELLDESLAGLDQFDGTRDEIEMNAGVQDRLRDLGYLE
jgi:arylsulfatase A-like enzyme